MWSCAMVRACTRLEASNKGVCWEMGNNLFSFVCMWIASVAIQSLKKNLITFLFFINHVTE